MALHVRVSGTYRDSALWARISGTWHCINMHVRVSGTWRQITNCFTAVLSSPTLSAACSNFTGAACTANSSPTVVTVTASGGSGSYTYSWAHLSGTSMSFSAGSTATTAMSRSSPTADPANVVVGVARVTVTDTVTSQVRTADVTFTTSHLFIPP